MNLEEIAEGDSVIIPSGVTGQPAEWGGLMREFCSKEMRGVVVETERNWVLVMISDRYGGGTVWYESDSLQKGLSVVH